MNRLWKKLVVNLHPIHDSETINIFDFMVQFLFLQREMADLRDNHEPSLINCLRFLDTQLSTQLSIHECVSYTLRSTTYGKQ